MWRCGELIVREKEKREVGCFDDEGSEGVNK